MTNEKKSNDGSPADHAASEQGSSGDARAEQRLRRILIDECTFERMPRWRRRLLSSCGAPVTALLVIGDQAPDELPAGLRDVVRHHLQPPARSGESEEKEGRIDELAAELRHRGRLTERGDERLILLHRISASKLERLTGEADDEHVSDLVRGAACGWVRECVRLARDEDASELSLVVLCPDDLLHSLGREGLLVSRAELARAATEGRFKFEALRRSDRSREVLESAASRTEPEAAADEIFVCGPLVADTGSFDCIPKLMAALSFARTLGNVPPNIATPAWIAEVAAEAARRRSMDVEIWNEQRIRDEGLGGLAAVGQGSRHAPRLLRLLSSTSRSGSDSRRRLALVGKGVTFDSGGLSIKPSASMEEMKYDKCGACTVIALALLLCDLELDLDLEVLVPLAENLPDAAAYRPSDILTMADGTTVEIINTDAEGRLLLADALALACRREPDLLLEFSTLTGAAVVALGENAAALYSPSDRLAQDFARASRAVGERFWRMPLWPEDLRRMKGTHGRLRNSSDRWGSANTAAAFLSHFVTVEQWAHLDIAGPAYRAKTGDHGEAGATAFGLLTALELIEAHLR